MIEDDCYTYTLKSRSHRGCVYMNVKHTCVNTVVHIALTSSIGPASVIYTTHVMRVKHTCVNTVVPIALTSSIGPASAIHTTHVMRARSGLCKMTQHATCHFKLETCAWYLSQVYMHSQAQCSTSQCAYVFSVIVKSELSTAFEVHSHFLYRIFCKSY